MIDAGESKDDDGDHDGSDDGLGGRLTLCISHPGLGTFAVLSEVIMKVFWKHLEAKGFVHGVLFLLEAKSHSPGLRMHLLLFLCTFLFKNGQYDP